MDQNINSLMTGLATSLNQYMGLKIQDTLETAKEERKNKAAMNLKTYESELDTQKGKNLELFKTTLEDAKKRGQSVQLSQLADDPEFGSLAALAPNALLDAKDLLDYKLKQQKEKTEKQPKEFQFKSANYYKLATSGENSLESLAKRIDLSSWKPLDRSDLTPEILRSNDWKEFMTARKAIAESYLRPATGATINKDEYANVDKIFMPLPGDNKKVLAKKTANRAGLRSALKAEAEGKAVDLTVFKPVTEDGGTSGGWSIKPVGQ